MFTALKRVLKFGWQGFARNIGLSLQVIFIMGIAVVLVTAIFFVKDVGSSLIAEFQKKVDISVSFKKEVEEKNILEVKNKLQELANQVERIDYVSKEEALASFLEKHKGEILWLEALEEVEDNPFSASLRIKAKEPGQYAQISHFLEEGPFRDFIERVSYSQNKKVIDKIFSTTANIKSGGFILSLVLGVLVILITFNTIKLSIFASKEEIATMRLVGASNWFIQAPFVIQGMLYAVLAVLIVNIVFFAGIFFLETKLETWFWQFNLAAYLQANFSLMLIVQLLFAGALGIFSTLLAVRKYLKI